ncbi:MAG: carboxypeptidase M32 [Candidatus Thorarchaeota archaeon]
MQANDAYKNLMKEIEAYYQLGAISSRLMWDTQTSMPPKGIEQRGKQFAFLRSLAHQKIASSKIKALLDSIRNSSAFEARSLQENRNVYLIERLHARETKIPSELVAESAKQAAMTQNIWREAKKKSNYSLFKPEFEKMLDLTKARAEALDASKDPYDVLIDAYFDPGMTSKKLTIMFEKLKKRLIPLIEKCVSSSHQPDTSLAQRACSLGQKQKIAEDVVRVVGYDLEAGRIDEAEHPFTSGSLSDVRITTNYQYNLLTVILIVLHEAGHAMYQQAINKAYAYQPVGEAVSFGVHESQSRFMDNNLGQSREFWTYYLPRLKQQTGTLFEDVDIDTMYFAVNQVALTPIRAPADELTYALHIILRFEIGKDLLNDKIDLDDLPRIWNAKMKDYLNIDITDDAEGVLQDPHWSGGAFGYFPSYELGNIYAAQIMAAMNKALPDYEAQIASGNFNGIQTWLNENIRQHGNLYDAEDLIEKATGEKPTVDYLLEYLETKYSQLYDL